MVPTKSSLCSTLNSYSLCLCLPSVPKRRERKKPTSHALKEKVVGVFFWFFHHSFLSFLGKPDLWCLEDAFALLEQTVIVFKKNSSLGSRPCLFAGLVGWSSIYPTWVVRLLATFIVLIFTLVLLCAMALARRGLRCLQLEKEKLFAPFFLG